MREQLCFLNSALVLVLIIGVAASRFLRILPPTRLGVSLQTSPSTQIRFSPVEELPLSQIYGRKDIFDLYSVVAAAPTKAVFPQVIPQINMPAEEEIPKKPEVQFIDPLNISLHGIFFSASGNEESFCMFSDETDKQKVYKINDPIKDGRILRILKDRVVILRFSGQLETYFMHDVDFEAFLPNYEKIFTKKSETSMQIDVAKFKNVFKSLGHFLEQLDFAPLLDQDTMKAMRILSAPEQGLAQALGLQAGDTINKINDLPFGDKKQRMQTYLSLRDLSSDKSSFSLNLNRAGKDLKINYNLYFARPQTEKSPVNVDAKQINKTLTDRALPESTPAVGATPGDGNVASSPSTVPSMAANGVSEEGKRINRENFEGSIAKIRQDLLERARKLRNER